MRRSIGLLALLGVAGAACDLPTEFPRWDQTWVAPGETIQIGMAELLPAGVGVNEDTTAFVTEAPGASLTFYLEQMCGSACVLVDGMVAPKPAFGYTLGTSTSLADDLVSATLAGGTVRATLEHDFSFDPLRPDDDPTDRGFLVVRVTSDGNVVAQDTLHGDDYAFPAGTPLTPSMAIRPVAVTNELQIDVEIYSPAGDRVLIDTSDTLGVAVAPTTVEIASATVAASSITIEPTSTTMDFSGLEEDGPVVEQIQGGAIRFGVENPFAVEGTVEVSFQLPFPIERALTLLADTTYDARLDFAGQELREILGSERVLVMASGIVSAPTGTVTLTPRQKLVLDTDFELVLRIGGEEEG
ncbi:MAG: hypothetical protein ACLFRX_11205 [Gemmatimonadota bacterium]